MIKKLIRYLVLSGIVLTTGLLGFVYLYQDQIIQRFMVEANRYIASPVRVKKISLSAFEHFPHIAITFEQVHVEGTLQEKDTPLAVADQLHFTFNIWQLLKGYYVIDKVFLKQAQVYLHLTDKEKNYDIFRAPENNSQDAAKVNFKLKHIVLSEVEITYVDDPAVQKHQFWTDHMDATLLMAEDKYDIELNGKLLSKGIQVHDEIYFKEKLLTLDALLHYDHPKRHLAILPSSVHIGKGHFLVQGTVNHAKKAAVDLSVDGNNTDLQTLLSLLPQATIHRLAAYRSEGDVYFNGKIHGTISSKESPAIQVNFGCNKASFYHPDYKKRLTHVSLTGSFTNGFKQNLSTSELILSNIEATLDNKPVLGDFSIRDFEKYFLTCRAEAELDINSLLAFYPIEEIQSASGLVKANFSIAGSLKDLQNAHAYRQQRVVSSGDITVKSLHLQFKDISLPFHSWNGNFIFKNNDLALNNLSGYLGNSHFLLNGLSRNTLAYLLTNHQFISIEADLYSKLIDVDELLSDHLSIAVSPKENTAKTATTNWQTTVNKQPYQFSIDPRLILNFTCDVDKLKFRRLRGEKLRGRLNIKNKIATVNNMAVEAAGGKVLASSTINTQSFNDIFVESSINLQHLHIDSVFYIFEEFGQDFLTSRHLKGYANVDLNWQMHFDKALHLDYPSLQVEALTTIKSGQLNDFEPMQRLARFVEEKSLTHLRFAEMSNQIRIANETIFIPRMLVSSNVSDVVIQGTHTFSNHINYHFEVPMRSFSIRSVAARERAAQRAQSFGEIAQDDARPMMLFLKATGTVDDYKISYDMPAAHDQFKKNLQEEKQELQEIFKNKGRKDSPKLELEEEYFDFNNQDNPE